MSATPATPTATPATPRRHRARLLVLAAIAVLAFTATTAAADTSPTTAAERTATAHDRGAAEQKPKAMLDAWLRLWNGDVAQAPGIISPGFRVHAALLDGGDGSSIRGVDGLVAWIGQTRAAFRDLRFTIEVPPLGDGRYASVRWTATGTYAGGFPGAKAQPGTVVTFTGTDTLRMRDGRFAEYWVNTDTLSLLTQLQAL
ncbi:SnoaL-like polyketide cyclase [Streptomyces sp. OV198]|uniref:ester cyclase n=1 Tax=unclassified Streptomyces TaxID=2593676 RepID=UPI000BCE22B7|nr:MULTISPECIES: ester cyclase [unclassified Streptomyces]PBC94103.1 SnoaL-like polyketide cyclase [Streptomyces sp. Ag82_O1-15]SOE53149.1 SnoaL-like polyketide cyclase [Streptomyces sp. OV198]